MDPRPDAGAPGSPRPDDADATDVDAPDALGAQATAPVPSAGTTGRSPGEGSRRRRRSHRGDGSWRTPRGRRSFLVLAGLVLVVAAAIGVPLALDGFDGATPTATPTFAAVLPSDTPPPPPPSASELGSLPPSPPPSLPPSPPGRSGAPGEPGVVADRIQVPRVGIDLPIVEGDGIDAPLGKAAHFPGTAWPAGGSNIYLYAHARDGMFIGLWKAHVGDQVIVHLSDGTDRTYTVSRVIPRVAWNDMSVIAPTSTEQLTLQTCTSNQQTSPRYVVIAVPAA